MPESPGTFFYVRSALQRRGPERLWRSCCRRLCISTQQPQPCLAHPVSLKAPLFEAQPELEKGDGPIVLVLAPTRELALQTQECLELSLESLSWKISVCCEEIFPQGHEVSHNPRN